VQSLLTAESAKMLVHPFVSNQLDYCNSLLYGISDKLPQNLQVIQCAGPTTQNELSAKRLYARGTTMQS